MGSTIFSDFLKSLGVAHTVQYSDTQFGAMPFQSLFGLSKLLDSYNVPNQGLQINDKTELTKLTPPFIADTADGLLIVTQFKGDNLTYLTQGESETIPIEDFSRSWNGVVLLAFPDEKSCEPKYASHRRLELLIEAKKYVLIAGALALFLYLFITNHLYAHWSTIALTIFNIGGLVFTYMLVQKTLNIHTKAANAVCGILEKGGCDSILSLKVSSFFGIFKWSEVGFTYFSVSLLALLIFPQSLPYLALCNAFCLPYTVWSIWYQKFRAKKWCTLCVSVQTTLWLLFICYLFGGWYHTIFPIRIGFFVLAVTYITVLLGLNRILPAFDNHQKNFDHAENTTSAS